MSRKSNKVTGSVINAPVKDAEYDARERRYRTEEALRTLSRADEIRRDRELMRDVKTEAKRMTATVLGKPSRSKTK